MPPSAVPVDVLPGAWLAFQSFVEPVPALLTPSEQTLFATLTAERRRREWFAGRMAARGALRACGAGSASILRADNGAPRLEGPHAEQVEVAITHGRDLAAAVATRRDARFPYVGLDLVDDSDQPRIARIARRALTDAERDLCVEDPKRLMLCWGVREAVAKATRTGMFVYALSEIALRAVGPRREGADRGALELNVDGFAAFFRDVPGGGVLVLTGATEDAVRRARASAEAVERRRG